MKPCHVWVVLNGRTFKAVFKENGKPSYIMEWRKAFNRNGGVFVRYWSSASRSRAGSLSARIIAAAEETRNGV